MNNRSFLEQPTEQDVYNPSIVFHIYDEDESFTFTPNDCDSQKRDFVLKKVFVSLYFNDILYISTNISLLDENNSAIFSRINTNCKISFQLYKKDIIINLPEIMSENLLSFLKKSRSDEDLFSSYCCTHFAYHLVHGFSETKKMEFEDNKIGVASSKLMFDESQLKPGNIVYLHNKKDMSFFHYAIYIEDGLYLSLMGRSRQLCITTANEMNKAWNTDAIDHVCLNRVQNDRRGDAALRIGLFVGIASLTTVGLLFFGSKFVEKNALSNEPSPFRPE